MEADFRQFFKNIIDIINNVFAFLHNFGVAKSQNFLNHN
jgi:hypothetical protein